MTTTATKPPLGPPGSKGARSTKMSAEKMKAQNVQSSLIGKYSENTVADSNALPDTLVFDHVSPATRLLEKRRQLFEVQEALNAQKEEFSRREDAFHRREEGLRRKDLELQESLIKFNKFLQENESKRNRALKRAAEERKQREAKEQEIKQLETKLKAKLKEERELKEELERNIKYQDYLDNVSQTMTKFFPEVSDILNRYRTLKDTNAYLISKQIADDGKYDYKLKDFVTFKKATENQILNETNEIAEMQGLYEQEKVKGAKLEAEIDIAIAESSHKTQTLGQILASASNLLDRCEESFRVRHNKPKLEKSADNFSQMPFQEQITKTILRMDEISMFIMDFIDMKAEFEKGKGGGNNSNLVGGGSSVIGSLNNTESSVHLTKSIASTGV